MFDRLATMEIAESTTDAVLVLSLRGRLDSVTSRDLDQRVRDRLLTGHRKLVVDLDAVDYVSSAGLRSLLIAAKALKAAHGHMAVCRLQAAVQEVFRVSGFDRVFTVLPSLDDSVARLAAAS